MNRYQILRGEKPPYVKPKITIGPWIQDKPLIIPAPEESGSVSGTNSDGVGWSFFETVGMGVFNPRAVTRVRME